MFISTLHTFNLLIFLECSQSFQRRFITKLFFLRSKYHWHFMTKHYSSNENQTGLDLLFYKSQITTFHSQKQLSFVIPSAQLLSYLQGHSWRILRLPHLYRNKVIHSPLKCNVINRFEWSILKQIFFLFKSYL